MLLVGLAAGRSEALVIKCEGVQVDGEQRWRLTDVVGEEDGLGIECLSGSGAIARYAAPSTCSLHPTRSTLHPGCNYQLVDQQSAMPRKALMLND